MLLGVFLLSILICFMFSQTLHASSTMKKIVLILVLFFVLWLILIVFSRVKFTSSQKNVNNKTSIKKSESIVLNKEKFHIPKFMVELYENNTNNTKAHVVKSLTPKNSETWKNVSSPIDFAVNDILVFELPETDQDESFISAELKIFTTYSNKTNVTKLHVFIYDLNLQKYTKQICINHSESGWVSFDLTSCLAQILEQKQSPKYLKIVLKISAEEHSNFKLSLLPLEENKNHNYPLLILTYEDHNLRARPKENVLRPKRSVYDDYSEPNNVKAKKRVKTTTCKRKPLYINFSEIEYDFWIIQPPGYEAFQCLGKCFFPVADHLTPTKHAILQSLVHSAFPVKATRSCCVPTVLDSISVLYVDKNGILTYRYAFKDMVVMECGCR